jgi:hypothetical protein
VNDPVRIDKLGSEVLSTHATMLFRLRSRLSVPREA